ncbi:glycosyltransferase [Octadecabacter sp. CECT 8868]|uniref:glycosyltransferase n=1 Tax=Octadecabacter algicola TaxID=2909342 RepID=UPI001F2CD432|nr:glycosyltransferase [Octadecabacter algicola]MCF2903373.1 glycosyltransferase [Octadecabacter algicola]
MSFASSFRGLLGNAFYSSKRAANAASRLAKMGPYKGYVDEVNADGMVRGWVFNKRTKQGRVQVALYAGDTLVEVGFANGLREDVRGVTGGEVECGFSFKLNDATYDLLKAAKGRLSVRTHGDKSYEIGSLTIAVDASNPAVDLSDAERCSRALSGQISQFIKLADETPEQDGPLPKIVKPPFKNHGLMFKTDPIIPEIPTSGHPAYLDYVRYRYRMDETYKVEPGLESQDRFLFWYLTAYRGGEKRRVPLSAELIDYLNEPIVMAGQTFSVSRVIWWRITGRPDLMGTLNLNDRDSFLNTLFWWAHQDCPHLNFEDCLIPDRYADFLRGVHPSRRLDSYPLSYFSERYFQNTPSLHFLRPGTASGRKSLVLAMMLAAVERPDLLRYIPKSSINSLLAEDNDGQSEFERFLNGLQNDDGEFTSMSRNRYAAILRKRGFDLDSFMFMTRDQDGNRFEAAALPLPDDDRETVDVQLIGPLAKASGLGQATRLSAAVLRETGVSIRGVDFDLDNPAPVGFSSDTLIEEYGPAKVNIIHLNAESTPLAYAYQPDVFSNSYNIGYFFWELDKPAYCHYLGMELLDEIWVSTEYGVDIYKDDAKGKPVVNVGMCFEDNTDITREDSRDFVNRLFQFDEEHYVCLVAFDSFSFVQRKNPVSVLKSFQKAFEGVKNARLVVKTQNRDSVFDPVQVQLWDQVDAIMSSDPRIVVLNQTLSYHDLLRLKCGSDCYISLHKSEGWGFGMIEAMNLKVPVVCTAYSGNMDFCSDETVWLVDYEISQLRHGDYIFVRPKSEWAEPFIEHAASQLRAAYDDPKKRIGKAEAAYDYISKNFSSKAIGKRYGGRLKEILEDL